MPSTYERITFLQMTWTVSNDPTPGNAFYSCAPSAQPPHATSSRVTALP